MKRCFSCGNKINEKDFIHPQCIKKLFGVNCFPIVNLSLSEISIKAQEMVGKLSISGIQIKLSMKLDRKSKELLAVAKRGEYILKPKIDLYPGIIQNENLCMTIAEHTGINVPPHALIKLKDGSWSYIVKRFDRINGKKIHQEDFCQILGKSTKEKYNGSAEQIANKLKEISEFPGLDIQHFYERLLLYFIIGNGDGHLKNFSVNYTSPDNIRLSPAYDVISSRLALPNEKDEFGIYINGKKSRITIKDFKAVSSKFNIPEKITTNILNKKSNIIELIKDSQLGQEDMQRLLEIVNERFSRLT